MPSKTRKSTPAESRPFGVESTAPYGAMDAKAKAAVAKAVATAKANGASGDEMRAEFGPLLTGPARRKVLRDHGYTSTAHIARSYGQYRDGDSRVGTRHAREHGIKAGERRVQAAADQAASADLSLIRKALREAGTSVPRAEAKARAAYQELLLQA